MSEFLTDYGLFLLKAITVIVSIALIVIIIAATGQRVRKHAASSRGHVEVHKVNEQLEDMQDALSLAVLDDVQRKQLLKDKKAEDKAEHKASKQAAKLAKRQRGKATTFVEAPHRRRVFVLDFDGDIRATAVETLRAEISAILTTATSDDEVVLRLDSGGGMVTTYGLAAAQLERLKRKRIPLTICVDTVAASGGYMMACVADKLLAAPFAVLGSIGVVAQIPNLHRLLKAKNIDFELLTAGKYKRTLTIFGENTDEGREKFIEDIEQIHDQFKHFVQRHRSVLDIDTVATGETWSGDCALEHKLVDRLCTSDEYLVDACEGADVLEVSFKRRRSVADRFGLAAESAVDRALLRWLDRAQRSQFLS